MSKFQENIKHLIPRPKTPVVKPPMYRSIYTESVRRTYKSNNNCHKTMGYAEVELDPPSQFLKKHTRKEMKPFVEINKTKCCARKSIQRPCDGAPTNASKKLPTKTRKNIRQTNIIDVIRRVPPLPKHRVQDTRNGHVIVLNEAGLEPTYVSKKNYGKTPAYIVKMYKEKEMAQLMETERKRAVKLPFRYLPEGERTEMLSGLKTNWAELHKEFLLLPMLTDTVPKMKRKTMLEKQLNNLEKDIDLLERNPSIYVCQDV
ncbi:enkurin-like [Metopolophium dirhodum]|uniref:enkurin-like n=1 Tax=Metopolophium dirhodum TaxID=44670 RepID=UPI0029900E1D|nr:enkurin-like [Metopolophium dirhodum]